MTFQGSLFENGEPFNGTSDLTFSIEIDSANTWTETLASVPVVNGLYSVVLGSTSPIPATLFHARSERTVTVKVGDVTLGNVKLYEPFSGKPTLPMDLTGPNGKRSVMLSSEGENGNDGTFRLSDENGFSRVTIFANRFDNGEDSLGAATRTYSGAGGAWFGGANGSQSGFISSDGPDNSNGYLSLADKEGVVRSRLGIREFDNGFTRGELNLNNNTDARNAILRPDQLYFRGDNSTYPAGWYGTYNGNSGFSQQVGFDSLGGFTGAILSGFWNENRPSLWLEDGDANMGAFLAIEEGAGMLQLNGPSWNPNIQMGPKNWENGNLPYFVMRGEDQVSGDSVDNEQTYYHPDLVFMEVQKWEDGTELGNLVLRGTDGSEFEISSHGINKTIDYRSKEYFLENQFDGRQVGNWKSQQNGGQINIGGINDENDSVSTQGGGISTGGKFWEGTPQLGYFHLRGTVNNDNYFGANMKFSLEAIDEGVSEEAELKIFGSELGEGAVAKTVLNMRSIRNDNGQSASEMTTYGSSSENIKLGAKVWEENGTELPFLSMKGTSTESWTDDGGTPEDSTDDVSGENPRDLIWMDVQHYEGTENGHIQLSGTDGYTHNLSHWIDEVRNTNGDLTYSQQRSNAFRIKNDSDPFSSVFLNRFSDGHARLQLAGHNDQGDFTGIAYLGANAQGGYSYIGAPDQGNNTLRAGMYVEENLPRFFMQGTFDLEGDINQDSLGNVTDTSYYRPELVNLDVRTDDNGNEFGNLTLSSSDGRKFQIGPDGLDPFSTKRIGLTDSIGEESAILFSRKSGGGGLYFPSKNGGVTYDWIQSRVLNDGSTSGSAQVANIGEDGSYITGTGMSGGFFYIDSWANDQFYTNVELGLTSEDVKLPYMHLRGSEVINWENDNDTPNDTTDDTSGSYLPDLITLRAERGDNGVEMGNFLLRSSDGSEFGINANGFIGTADNLNVNNMHANGDVQIGNFFDSGEEEGLYINQEGWINAEGATYRGNVYVRAPNDSIQDQDGNYFKPNIAAFEIHDWGEGADAYDMGALHLQGTDGSDVFMSAHDLSSSTMKLDFVGGGLNLKGDLAFDAKDFTLNDGQNDYHPRMATMVVSKDDADTEYGELSLNSTEEGHAIRMYGGINFDPADTNSTTTSHIALDGPNGSYVYLWGDGHGDFTSFVSATSFNQTSDKRFKKDVNKIQGALEKLEKLNGYTYFWNREAKSVKGINDDSEQIGVLAQEIEAVFPQLVNTDKEGYKSVNYGAMTAILIEAVKELNAEITMLKSENKVLKAEASNAKVLEDRLLKIERLLGVKTNETSSANK